MNALNDLPSVNTDAKNSAPQVVSEIPKPPSALAADEKRIWKYITEALFEYGLIHKTDGITLTVICKTFCTWVRVEKQLEDVVATSVDGTYFVTTPNGYSQPHQAYYMARNLKKELLQWLPEAALTIPSFQKFMGEVGAPSQGGLFDDPVTRHRDNKTKIGTVLKFDGSKSKTAE